MCRTTQQFERLPVQVNPCQIKFQIFKYEHYGGGQPTWKPLYILLRHVYSQNYANIGIGIGLPACLHGILASALMRN